MVKNAPIYHAIINDQEDDTNMFAVSLVSAPAVEKDFLVFNTQKETLKFAVENEEKRIVTGLIMSCDTPIFRLDAAGNPFYLVFDAETIKVMTRKFLREGFNTNTDLEHSFDYIEGVELMEIYIKDTERNINPLGFEDVKDGSLFGTYYIKDDEVWAQIKDGTFKGFSIEVTCEISEEEFSKPNELDEIENLLKEINNKLRK